MVNKVYYGQCERIPSCRRKTIWLFRKLAKVLSWSIPSGKQILLLVRVIFASGSTGLRVQRSEERIGNVRFMAQVAVSESTSDFYFHN